MTLPLLQAPPLPLPLAPARAPDVRPPAVAVLEDWLGEHAPKWRTDPQRDWLETWQGGIRHEAPWSLLEQAFTEAWACWETLTAPSKVLPLLASMRGRGTVGRMWLELYLAGLAAHREALELALEHGVLVRHVRTWITSGRYGCASDEVRLHGCGVVARRLHRITEDSQQAIRWPTGAALPEGWVRDGDYIRRSGAEWRGP